MSAAPKKWRLTRRQFLIGLGATGGALALGITVGLPPARLKIAEMLDNVAMPAMLSGAPTLWFEVLPDNRVRLHLPKVEMGQGVHTALAQIAADELEVVWAQLEVVQASTAHGPVDSAGTSGSSTISSLFQPLREAAATMRELLRAEAARQLGVSVETLHAEAGAVQSGNDTTQRLTYAQIVAQKTGEWDIPETPPTLKALSAYQYIGQSMPRVDFPAKLRGEAVYGYDARVPGMLYGVMARPYKLGATLKSAEAGEALTRPGVVQVVIEKGFAGVVAETRTQAFAGLSELKLEWTEVADIQQADIDRLTTVRAGQGVIIQRTGDVDAQLKTPTLTAEYRSPLAAHAHLEPQAALADVQADKVTVWVSTQAPGLVRTQVAQALGRKEETVEVLTTFLGGGFGRRVMADVALEAARLSAAVGRPVHVGWTRPDEFMQGYFRPPTHHQLSARLSATGQIEAFEHQQASGDVLFAFLAFAAPLLGADFGAWRGAIVQYDIPHRRTTAQRVELPVRTGPWRGLGLLPNTFAVESFMDELAHAANIDPLEFRLRHLAADERGQRFARVLKAAAERAGWGTPLPPGRAHGIACSIDVNTIVAEVAEVSIENNTIRVHRVTAAVDCGLVVNPDIATAQTEGAIVMGLSSTLLEEITVKDGRIEAGNFNTYPLLTLQAAPEIDTVFVPTGDVPFGMGEPPIGPIAAAVANAVFALTGQRLRRLPLKLA